MRVNLFKTLQDGYQKNLGKTSIETPTGETWSFAELDELSARFAGLLRAKGVKPGDRVVVQIDKSPGGVGLYLGVLRIGAVFVPLNIAYTPNEVEYFLSNARPSLFVCQPGSLDALSEIAQAANVPAIAPLGTSSDAGLWREALDTAPDDAIEMRDETDVAAIVYTSGTTGRSKGAMLSHRALISNTHMLHELWEFEPDDVLIHALPIFHVHGLFFALHTSLLNASTMLFHPGFDAAAVRKEMPRATILMGVPTYYSRLLSLDGFGKEDCKSMRLFVSGSAPLTAQASEEWTEATGHAILERYGMSEAGVITSNPYNGERLPGTVGYAMPGTEVKICDTDGAALPAGSVGSIEIRGPNLFNGYWEMPEKTAQEVREDGFFITGDLGELSEDGRLKIVGRSKDLIISGGYNIYPKEIESVLDDVEGVKESAVVGVPHADVGEGVVAVLVAEADEIETTTLQTALDDNLARFKHPRRFYWLSELPRNTMGKVQKNKLREQFETAYSD
ncbi:MAG: AMP-binding protein [Pseudomonadota bacterium]